MAQSALLTAFLAQVCLAVHCLAAPIAQSAERDNAWEFGTTHGILGLAVLILDIIVFSTSDPPAGSVVSGCFTRPLRLRMSGNPAPELANHGLCV